MPRSRNTRREPAEQVSNAEDTLLTVEDVLTRAQKLIGAETQSGDKSADYFKDAPCFRAYALHDLPEARKALGVLCLWHFRKSPPQEKLRWAIEGREWLEPLSNDLYVKKWLVEFEWYSTPNTAGHPPHNDLLTDFVNDNGMGADALINKKLEELWNLLAELGVPEVERLDWIAGRMAELLPASQHQVAAAATTRLEAREYPTVDDSTLGRLRRRYQELLRTVELPEGGFETREQARAAGRLVLTYHNLCAHQISLSLQPEPQNSRVKEAQRLRVAFYRRATHGQQPEPVRRRIRRGRTTSKGDAKPS